MKNRKDNKKRNLRSGEYQRADGRYEYRFRDEDGKTRSVYSYRLVPTDTDQSGRADRSRSRRLYSRRSYARGLIRGTGGKTADTVLP